MVCNLFFPRIGISFKIDTIPCFWQVEVVRGHFAMFGEVASVEVEDAEGHKIDTIQPLTANSNLRVSFTNRQSAERALGQGRWLQGQTLHLTWAPVSSSSRTTEGHGAANSSLLTGNQQVCNREGNGHGESVGMGAYTSEEDNASANDETKQVLLRVPQQQQSPEQGTNT
jgi:hypothetical protein